MIFAVIMAGGKGERLKADVEKPLYLIKNTSLIDYVMDNVNTSKLIQKVIIAISPHTVNTKNYLINKHNIKDFKNNNSSNSKFFYLETPGNGYVNDLSFILDTFESNSKDDTLVFINSDLPLVNGEIIDSVLDHYLNQDKPALSVSVPVEIFDKFHLPYSYAFNGTVPSGLNILKSQNVVQEEEVLIIPRYELAFNVNTIETAILFDKFL